MPLTMTNKPQLTGIIILGAGVILLAFTFINAFLFLQEPLGIIASGDLARVFGEALAPLIQACVRLMYLGIMGWIGSLLTVRSIPLVTHKHVPVALPVAATQAKPQPQQESTPKPKSQPATQPTPRVQPEPVSSQPEPEPQSTPSLLQEQTARPIDRPTQEEPKAILIPPENRREE